MLAYQKEYHNKNKEKHRKYQKEWRNKNMNKIIEFYQKNKEQLIKYARNYYRNNPRSGGWSESIELQEAMNNVRKRDKNTCKWQGCGLTHRQAPIQVHHIFPRSEYPELELIEQYMITYCLNHHIMWHIFHGDTKAVNIMMCKLKNRV